MMVLEGGVFAFDIAEDAGSDLDETVERVIVVDPAVARLLPPPSLPPVRAMPVCRTPTTRSADAAALRGHAARASSHLVLVVLGGVGRVHATYDGLRAG